MLLNSLNFFNLYITFLYKFTKEKDLKKINEVIISY